MTIDNQPVLIPGSGDGLPRRHERFYPGSGPYTIPGDLDIGIPAGIEAVWEYRGLRLNVQRNIDRYRISSIDGLGDADIRDTRDANTGFDGETPFNSYYGGRTITITGTIETYTVGKLRDMQYALKKVFSDLTREYPLHVRTGDFNRDHIIYCKKIGSLAMTEQQSSGMMTRDFQISLRASNPRFLSYYYNFIDIDLGTGPGSEPQVVGVAHNRGNYTAQPIFRVWGPVTSAVFLSDETGHSFTVYDVAVGDFIDFDTSFPPSVRNSVGKNMWDALSDDSQLIPFHPGDTTLVYTGDAPAMQVSWRDSWI